MAQTLVNFRLDEETKKEMEQACQDMGMNMTTAFTIFAKKVARERRIPFEISVSVPNAETRAVLQEVEDMRNGKIPITTQSLESFLEEMSE